MKKIVLLACTFISFATISQAQIKKGSILLGGSIGVIKLESENEANQKDKLNSTLISPTVGLAIKDNWVVGISVGFNRLRQDVNTSSSQNTEVDGISGGVFVRRYAPLGKNFYLYGNGTLNYNTLERKESYNTDFHRKTDQKGATVSLAPGVAYAVGKRFHLEASLNDLFTLGYSKSKTEETSFGSRSIEEEKNFALATNFNVQSPLSIGFRFVIGK